MIDNPGSRASTSTPRVALLVPAGHEERERRDDGQHAEPDRERAGSPRAVLEQALGEHPRHGSPLDRAARSPPAPRSTPPTARAPTRRRTPRDASSAGPRGRAGVARRERAPHRAGSAARRRARRGRAEQTAAASRCARPGASASEHVPASDRGRGRASPRIGERLLDDQRGVDERRNQRRAEGDEDRGRLRDDDPRQAVGGEEREAHRRERRSALRPRTRSWCRRATTPARSGTGRG